MRNLEGDKNMRRKLLCVALSLCLLVCGTVGMKNGVAVKGEEVVNFAEGKYVLSSSNESNDLMAEKAVDGDLTTRWSSAFIDNQWIMVDLGQIYTVGSVVLYWEDAYASNYTIQWSQDGETWNTAVTSNISSAGEHSHMMYNRPIRYIKIIGNERATEYGISLYEIKVLGFAN